MLRFLYNNVPVLQKVPTPTGASIMHIMSHYHPLVPCGIGAACGHRTGWRANLKSVIDQSLMSIHCTIPNFKVDQATNLLKSNQSPGISPNSWCVSAEDWMAQTCCFVTRSHSSHQGGCVDKQATYHSQRLTAACEVRETCKNTGVTASLVTQQSHSVSHSHT